MSKKRPVVEKVGGEEVADGKESESQPKEVVDATVDNTKGGA